MRKKFLFINRKPPHGSSHAQEALDIVLVAAAFDQDVRLMFIDDGVYQLLQQQNTQALARKNFAKAFRALEHHDVQQIYVEAESLQQRGLQISQLLVPVKVLTSEALREFIAEHDVILSF